MSIVVVSGTSSITVIMSARQRLRTALLMLVERRLSVRAMVEMTSALHTTPHSRVKQFSTNVTIRVSSKMCTVSVVLFPCPMAGVVPLQAEPVLLLTSARVALAAAAAQGDDCTSLARAIHYS